MAASVQSLVFFLTCLVFGMFVPSTADFFTDEFKKWMENFGVKYDSPDETLNRLAIFKINYMFINASNANPAFKFKLGLNKFSDMTNEEFIAKLTGYKPNANQISTPFAYGDVTTPASIDWRRQGAVTGVKDQGSCGSCWAFGAVATIEGITKIRKGYLPILSEQEIVDCVTESYGCDGGWQYTVFNWVIKNGGMTSESDYPYTAQDGVCLASKTKHYVASITGYQNVPVRNETALMKAVSMQPVTVTIDAGGLSFQFYQSGIFSGPCGTRQNHAVTAVGYGGSGSNKYWIVKNSWGNTWGDNGYILMKKDISSSSGTCGITLGASYPVA